MSAAYFKILFPALLNNVLNVAVCDAREADDLTFAGPIKKGGNGWNKYLCLTHYMC